MGKIGPVTLTLVLVWTLLTGACTAQEKKIFSGPQKGESLFEFRVLQIVNPETSKEVQIKPKDEETTFIIFLHKVTEPAMGLMMTIDWFASKQKGLDCHYVMLSKDKTEAEKRAQRWSSRSLLKTSTCVSLDGAEGPGQYGLNRNAVMTVLIAKDNVVVSNFVMTQPNNTDAAGVLAALAEALDKPAPSYEKIRAEMGARRKQQRAQRMAQNPVVKLAPDPELGRLMIAMIFREDINEEIVQQASQKLTNWAGDDKEKNAALVKYCKALLEGEFDFSRYTREGLEKLVGEE